MIPIGSYVPLPSTSNKLRSLTLKNDRFLKYWERTSIWFSISVTARRIWNGADFHLAPRNNFWIRIYFCENNWLFCGRHTNWASQLSSTIYLNKYYFSVPVEDAVSLSRETSTIVCRCHFENVNNYLFSFLRRGESLINLFHIIAYYIPQ